jgi:hypothetical protein
VASLPQEPTLSPRRQCGWTVFESLGVGKALSVDITFQFRGNVRIPKNLIEREGIKRNLVIITVGKTWTAKDQERMWRGKDLQNRVLASFEGIDRFCFEVTDAQWFSNIQIPKDAL